MLSKKLMLLSVITLIASSAAVVSAYNIRDSCVYDPYFPVCISSYGDDVFTNITCSDCDSRFLLSTGDVGVGNYKFQGNHNITGTLTIGVGDITYYAPDDVWLLNQDLALLSNSFYSVNYTLADTFLINKDTYLTDGDTFYQPATSLNGLAGRTTFNSKASAYQEYYFRGAGGYLSYVVSVFGTGFASDGRLGFTTINDEITFNSPKYIQFYSGSPTNKVKMSLINTTLSLYTYNDIINIQWNDSNKLVFEGATNGYVFNDGNVGIGNSTPLEALSVNGNVIADDYLYNSPVPDFSNVDVMDYLHDWDYYVNPDGSLKHEAEAGYYMGKVTDYSKPVSHIEYVTVCVDYTLEELGAMGKAEQDKAIADKCHNETESIEITEYPFEKEVGKSSLIREYQWLRQVVYELNERVKVLEAVK